MTGKHDAKKGDGAFFSVFFNEELYLLKNEAGKPQAESAVPSDAKTALPELTFSGNINAQTAVLFNNPAGSELPEDELALLQRILAAVKLSWDDVAWLNTAGRNDLRAWDSLHHAIRAGNVLAFGLQPELLPPGVIAGEPVRLNDRWFLSVEGLDIIGQSQEKKKILWDALQKIFRP